MTFFFSYLSGLFKMEGSKLNIKEYLNSLWFVFVEGEDPKVDEMLPFFKRWLLKEWLEVKSSSSELV